MARRIVFAVAAVALIGAGIYVIGHKNAPAMKQIAVVGSVIEHARSGSQQVAPAVATPADPTRDPAYVGSGKQSLDCMYNAPTEAAYKHFGCERIDGPWHAPVKDPLGDMTGSKVKSAAP